MTLTNSKEISNLYLKGGKIIMKKLFYCIVFLSLSLFLFSSGVKAQGSSFSFGYELVKDSSGSLLLKINTNAASSGMWVGVTLYPPQVKNLTLESKNYAFPVKQGTGIIEVNIEPQFKNGTFEAAL